MEKLISLAAYTNDVKSTGYLYKIIGFLLIIFSFNRMNRNRRKKRG